jgi:hypothetical protein
VRGDGVLERGLCHEFGYRTGRHLSEPTCLAASSGMRGAAWRRGRGGHFTSVFRGATPRYPKVQYRTADNFSEISHQKSTSQRRTPREESNKKNLRENANGAAKS